MISEDDLMKILRSKLILVHGTGYCILQSSIGDIAKSIIDKIRENENIKCGNGKAEWVNKYDKYFINRERSNK